MLLAIALAYAQSVSTVPAGARAVTVYVCERDCEPGWRALAAWSNTLRLPTMDFDQVAIAARDTRLDAYDAAMLPVRAGTVTEAQVAIAVAAAEACPYTLPNDDLVAIAFAGAAAAPETAQRSIWLERAATWSERRSYNLPKLPDAVLAEYLDLVAAPAKPTARVRVETDVPVASLFVDGRPVASLPAEIELSLGEHRLTVERPGRRTAWVGNLVLIGDLALRPELAGDDSNAALERIVLAALDDVPAPAAEVSTLTRWARDEGLEWVRFVSLAHRGNDEIIADPDPTRLSWRVRDVYLDVARGRLAASGPGTNAMIAAADVERFRIGAVAGYLQLAPRDHVTIDLAASYRLTPLLSADVRLGLAHSAQPYYLYEDWIDSSVYPVSVGARVSKAEGGPFVGAAALAVIPYAVGGELRAGWEFAPSFGMRVTVEARGGWTDHGGLAGVGVGVASRR